MLTISSLASIASTKKLPLYEVGLATILINSADYPGSDENSSRYIITPTLIYRGEKLRQDKRGTRTRFFKSDKWVLDLGTGLSLPSNSDENKAREGMDDLGFVLEMGPRLIYTVFEADKSSLLVLLPYRFALATDFSFTKKVGTRINPELEYTQLLSSNLTLRLGVEFSYASETFNDYYYAVESKDATQERAEYNGKRGYLGSNITTTLIYRKTRFAAYLGLSYNRYDNSANADSPLFKTNEGAGIALGINYFYYQSSEFGEKAAGVD